MDQLSSLRFDIWTDGKRDMCALDWRTAEYALPYEEAKLIPGLKGQWFVMTREEFESVSAGKVSALVDGYHKAEVWGDSWMFYDFSVPNSESGEMKVPYRRINLPRLFVKALLRIARRTWDLQRKYQSDHQTRIEWDIPLADRKRACRLYGQGLGSVRWDFSNPEAAAMLGHLRAAGGSSLKRGLEGIERIALNSTRGFHQTAVLRVHGSLNDPSGFDWAAYAPSGRFIMNGGLINHDNRNGGHDWSVHT